AIGPWCSASGMESCTSTRSTTTPTARRWRPSRKKGPRTTLPGPASSYRRVARVRRERADIGAGSHDLARGLADREIIGEALTSGRGAGSGVPAGLRNAQLDPLCVVVLTT